MRGCSGLVWFTADGSDGRNRATQKAPWFTFDYPDLPLGHRDSGFRAAPGKVSIQRLVKKSPTFTYICRHLPTYQRHELMKLTAKARQKLLALVLH
jgi:hypothetical protein